MDKVKCGFCGRQFEKTGKRSRQSFCAKSCYRAWLYCFNKTENPTNTAEFWTEERKQDARTRGQERKGKARGYKKYHQRHEHRVVAESIIGRPLKANEVVHHKDGNKGNNDPANLEVLTRSEHARLHFLEYWRKRKGGDAE